METLTGQQVIYVTERAVFELTPSGVRLTEIAPGVDLQQDVLGRMGFIPLMPESPAIMDVRHFQAPADPVSSQERDSSC